MVNGKIAGTLRSCPVSHVLLNSKINDSLSSPSLARSVRASSLPAHLRILSRASKLTPKFMGLSQRYLSKPSWVIRKATRDTCARSRACIAIPAGEHSKFTSAKPNGQPQSIKRILFPYTTSDAPCKNDSASIIRLSVEARSNLASSMMVEVAVEKFKEPAN